MDQQPRVRYNMEFLAGLVGQYQPENYKQGSKVKAVWLDISRQYSQELGLAQPVNYKLLLQAWKNKKQYAKKKARRLCGSNDNLNANPHLDSQTQLILSGLKKIEPAPDVEILCLPDSDAYLQDNTTTSESSNPEQVDGSGASDVKGGSECGFELMDTPASSSLTPSPSIPKAKPLTITRPYVTKLTLPTESTNNLKDTDRLDPWNSKMMESRSRDSHLRKLHELELKRANLEVKIMEAKERAALADERAAIAREQEALLRVQLVKIQLKQAHQGGT